MDADPAHDGASVEEDHISEPEPSEKAVITSETPQRSEGTARPGASGPTIIASTDEPSPISRGLFYVGILLVGSFLGLLSFNYVRRK
jgi:hypothetical protein